MITEGRCSYLYLYTWLIRPCILVVMRNQRTSNYMDIQKEKSNLSSTNASNQPTTTTFAYDLKTTSINFQYYIHSTSDLNHRLVRTAPIEWLATPLIFGGVRTN